MTDRAGIVIPIDIIAFAACGVVVIAAKVIAAKVIAAKVIAAKVVVIAAKAIAAKVAVVIAAIIVCACARDEQQRKEDHLPAHISEIAWGGRGHTKKLYAFPVLYLQKRIVGQGS